MTEIAELGIKIDPSGVESGLNKANYAFNRFKKNAVNSIKTVGRGFNNLRKTLFSLKSAIAGIGIGLLAKSFINAASASEQFRVRLTVLLGSVKEGNKLFSAMSKFAGQVPFEYEKIMSSATSLAGVMKGGVEQIKKWMPLISDLSAVSGLSLEQTTSQFIKMFSAGSGAADLFRERGILALLGFQSGVSYTAEQSRKIMMDAWKDVNSSFRGATKLLARTWEGTMSMISDKWFAFRNQIMNAGLFDWFKSLLMVIDKNFGEGLNNNKKMAKAWSDAIIRFIEKVILSTATLIDFVKKPFNLVVSGVKNLINLYKSLPEGVKELGLIGFLMLGTKGKVAVLGASGFMTKLGRGLGIAFAKAFNPDIGDKIDDVKAKMYLFEQSVFGNMKVLAESPYYQKLKKQLEDLRNKAKESAKLFNNVVSGNRVKSRNIEDFLIGKESQVKGSTAKAAIRLIKSIREINKKLIKEREDAANRVGRNIKLTTEQVAANQLLSGDVLSPLKNFLSQLTKIKSAAKAIGRDGKSILNADQINKLKVSLLGIKDSVVVLETNLRKLSLLNLPNEEASRFRKQIIGLSDKLTDAAEKMRLLDTAAKFGATRNEVERLARQYFNLIDPVEQARQQIEINNKLLSKYPSLASIIKRANIALRETIYQETNARKALTAAMQREFDNKQRAIELSRAELDVKSSKGILTDIQLMNKRNELIKREIKLRRERIEKLRARGGAENMSLSKQLEIEIKNLESSIESLGKKISDIFDDSFSNFFEGVISGTKSLKAAFSDLANSIFKDINRIVSKNIAQSFARSVGLSGPNGIASILGGFFGDKTSNIADAAASLAIPKFADGGSFRVGGSGGIDSQLVAFRASPNERVTITKPNQESGRSINIVNNFSISSPDGNVSRESQQQIAAAVGQSIRIAVRRNG